MTYKNVPFRSGNFGFAGSAIFLSPGARQHMHSASTDSDLRWSAHDGGLREPEKPQSEEVTGWAEGAHLRRGPGVLPPARAGRRHLKSELSERL